MIRLLTLSMVVMLATVAGGCATGSHEYCADRTEKIAASTMLNTTAEVRLLGVALPGNTAGQFVYCDLTKLDANGIDVGVTGMSVPPPFVAGRFKMTLKNASQSIVMEFLLGKNQNELTETATATWRSHEFTIGVDVGWLALVRRWPQTLGGVTIGPAHGIIAAPTTKPILGVSKAASADFWYLLNVDRPLQITNRAGSVAKPLATKDHYIRANGSTISDATSINATDPVSVEAKNIRNWMERFIVITGI